MIHEHVHPKKEQKQVKIELLLIVVLFFLYALRMDHLFSSNKSFILFLYFQFRPTKKSNIRGQKHKSSNLLIEREENQEMQLFLLYQYLNSTIFQVNST